MAEQRLIFVDQFAGRIPLSPWGRYDGLPVMPIERVLRKDEVFLVRVRASDGAEFHVAPWELEGFPAQAKAR